MRIALYGGSFNPPHLAHQLACATLLAAGRPRVDEVWLIPTFQHAFDKPLVPYGHRVAMCETAARIFGGRVLVSRIEEELGGASYTSRTLAALRARDPSADFVWVIGADLVEERVRWHAWAELERSLDFLIIGRRGAAAAPLSPRDHRVPIELPAVSSTETRRRLAAGEDTEGFLDTEVARYVAEHGLYR